MQQAHSSYFSTWSHPQGWLLQCLSLGGSRNTSLSMGRRVLWLQKPRSCLLPPSSGSCWLALPPASIKPQAISTDSASPCVLGSSPDLQDESCEGADNEHDCGETSVDVQRATAVSLPRKASRFATLQCIAMQCKSCQNIKATNGQRTLSLQRAKASSSSSYTLIHTLSTGKPMTFVDSSHAICMASSLK